MFIHRLFFRRTKTIPDTTFDELKKVLDGFGIDANTLKKTEQNC